MYRISKSVQFCYGHRLLNYPGKCRHLHGHNAKAVVTLESESLDKLGMVYDFKDIGDVLKKWIDLEIDHTLLLHKDDPILPALRAADERVLVVDWNPTAENIARMILEFLVHKAYPVTDVSVWETESCCASYSAKS
jgi:6-pyruvoyltetrahydropterin/6-carboxytetrahydropterin synthase